VKGKGAGGKPATVHAQKRDVPGASCTFACPQPQPQTKLRCVRKSQTKREFHMVTIQKLVQKRYILMAALMLSTLFALGNKSFAITKTAGCNSGGNVTLKDDQNWTPLCSTSLTLTGTQSCIITASAQIPNKDSLSSVHNEYLFTVDTEDNPTTGSNQEREIDVTQNSTETDPQDFTVSTVRRLTGLTGTVNFYWLGRRDTSHDDSDPTVFVDKYTMGVVCTDGK
jgi:hypothetical protein